MATAFKCDNCGDYVDGKPSRHSEVLVGNDLVMGVVFGRKLQEAATPDSTDKLMAALAEDESALGKIIVHSIEAQTKKRETVPAELCQACEGELVLVALGRLRSGDAELTFKPEEDEDEDENDLTVMPLSGSQVDDLKRSGNAIALGPLKRERR